MPGEEAINNVTNQALSGNPIAIVLMIAAIVYMADKVWFHAKGKQRTERLCDPEVIEQLNQTTRIQAEILKEVGEFREAADRDHDEMLSMTRDHKNAIGILLDRASR